MAVTIKDVALLAGVSLGTASNVFNGKPVRRDLAEAVERAAAQLGYNVDVRAKQLKTNVTRTIGVILPDLDTFGVLLAGVEQECARQGYRILPIATGNLAVREREAVKRLARLRVDGLVVVTCLDDGAVYAGKDIPPVVFAERKPDGIAADFVSIYERDAFRQLMDTLASRGVRHFVLLIEDLFQRLHFDAAAELNRGSTGVTAAVCVVDDSRESAFGAACRTLCDHPETEVILTTGRNQQLGARDAVVLYGLQDRCRVLSMQDDSACDRVLPVIIRPERTVGERAAALLIDRLGDPERPAFAHEILPAVLRVLPESRPQNRQAMGSAVTFLMLDCPAAEASELLVPPFRSETGVDVRILKKTYNELQEAMLTMDAASPFDGGMVDLTWLAQLAEDDLLLPIAGFHEELYLDTLCREYGRYNRVQYGLPFMPGTTILFYRKDLFENGGLKRRYNRATGLELAPPKDWDGFNRIARFFTQAEEPDSPTAYGITASTLLDAQVATDFCMRNWSFGGTAFERARTGGNRWSVAVDSPATLAALERYLSGFRYTVPWHDRIRQENCVDDFLAGRAAMMTLFDSHATRISRQTLAALPAEVGYSIVPGGHPVLGGWALSAGKHSSNAAAAQMFIRYICGSDIALPFAVLSGATAHNALYDNELLVRRYPWMPTVYESYRNTRKRGSAPGSEDTILRITDFEAILASGVRLALGGAMTAEQALRHIASGLQTIL